MASRRDRGFSTDDCELLSSSSMPSLQQFKLCLRCPEFEERHHMPQFEQTSHSAQALGELVYLSYGRAGAAGPCNCISVRCHGVSSGDKLLLLVAPWYRERHTAWQLLSYKLLLVN